MDLDAEAAGGWVGRWWTEAVLGLLALVGVATGVRAGDPVRVVVAVALAAAVVDRLRLRLDNRSLAVAVTGVRDERVSSARRETSIAPGRGGAEEPGSDAGVESEPESESAP